MTHVSDNVCRRGRSGKPFSSAASASASDLRPLRDAFSVQNGSRLLLWLQRQDWKSILSLKDSPILHEKRFCHTEKHNPARIEECRQSRRDGRKRTAEESAEKSVIFPGRPIRGFSQIISLFILMLKAPGNHGCISEKILSGLKNFRFRKFLPNRSGRRVEI